MHEAPHLKPGEEHKDPLDEIKPKCLSSCADWTEYNNCVTRISMRTDGKGSWVCYSEQPLQLSALRKDHCVAHEIFHHVK
eukprot:Skav223143  [mRNA]  locus=scaffold470:242871:244191:- [translate_table: standard]